MLIFWCFWHPNIIPLHGVCTYVVDGVEIPSLVFPAMKGDILHIILDHIDSHRGVVHPLMQDSVHTWVTSYTVYNPEYRCSHN